MGMGALRRNRGMPSRFSIVVFMSITILFFFDSCRLLHFTFPDCSFKEHEFFTPQQQQTASQVLTGPSLASQQSYGFFNDITDESWKLMQQRAWSSLHVKGQALPEIRNSNNDEDPTVVSSYLNNLQVSVVQSIVPILNACIVKESDSVTSVLILFDLISQLRDTLWLFCYRIAHCSLNLLAHILVGLVGPATEQDGPATLIVWWNEATASSIP